ncbi:DedA family protein [Nocardioides marmorisolisilvae]|uniref:DedA family protein n=1 Tax=Nocardioides marmorisolisilvae TaxID=1542737 RepID=UPI001613629A|nr:DedA family protein [Nocardioides marmorisolisilvae]
MPGFPDLTALEPGVLLAAAAGLVFLQAALVIGIFIPGGKAAFLTGLTASLGHLPLWLSYSSIAAAIVTGSAVGYLIGRAQGPRLLGHKALVKRRAKVESAQALLHRRVLVAMIGGRYVAALRAILPSLAGASGIDQRRFLVGNLVGGLAWAAVSVGSGFVGGTSLLELSKSSPVTWGAVGLIAVAVLGVVLVLRRRSADVPEPRAD